MPPRWARRRSSVDAQQATRAIPVEIGFNPGFIVDALKVIDDENVIVELKAANKPGVLRTGNDFTYVVMPVNLQ